MKFETEVEMLDYLEKNAYSAVFSDIMDEINIRHQVISPFTNIRPLKDDYVVMGRSVTMLNVHDDDCQDPYDLVIECIDAIEPNSVLVSTGIASLDTGIMGELTATALRARSARGAIVNGFSRDVRKINKMNYPTFAWGASPIDTTGRVRVIEYNTEIVIGGVKIHPGDLIFADIDGLVVIPHGHEEEIIAKTIERINTENVVRNELAKGCKMREVWNRYHVL